MITVRARKDDVNDGIVYYIDLIKKVNGVKNIFHIGRKTEMEFYHFIDMLNFLNVEYEIYEGYFEDRKGNIYGCE